ncbi:MAG TPA: histidine kinase, partial [Chitinophagaceae bacterium]|nr:histidine kinase [Chitinophagaceae bacterium]
TREGLPTNYMEGALTSLSNGKIAAGYNAGIIIIDPDHFPINTEIPAVNFSEIRILDKPIAWHWTKKGDKEIRLRHYQNVIHVSFSVLNFTSSYQNKFFYKLEGFDPEWRQSPDGHISFTNLSPGSYTLKIKGSNNSGVTNEQGDALKITVSPPFHQTWLFRILLLITVAAMALWFIKRRINNIRKEAQVKQKIAETEMMALRAQMNPHFIFNCINSIDALIQSNDKYQATVYLNKFAKLIRNILDSSKQNTVPLSKDIETLRLYIDLEQFRNENKFTAEIITDETLLQDDYKVPPLIIQPYIENAILHGLRNKRGNDGKLFLSIQKKGEHIQYIIEDNGPGRNGKTAMPQKDKSSYGMQMSSDRIKLFNKQDKASVQITDLTENSSPAGTKVEVLLKIQ